MADSERTVTVEQINYYSLKMTWQHEIDKADLQPAFQQITKALQQSDYPLYIVIDLSQNPQLPIVDTMMEALRGPFRHPRLAEWLVFGKNRSAQWIADLLTNTTKRNNIHWFDSQEEVLAYLDTISI